MHRFWISFLRFYCIEEKNFLFVHGKFDKSDHFFHAQAYIVNKRSRSFNKVAISSSLRKANWHNTSMVTCYLQVHTLKLITRFQRKWYFPIFIYLSKTRQLVLKTSVITWTAKISNDRERSNYKTSMYASVSRRARLVPNKYRQSERV